MLQASTTLFKQGETFAIGFGLITAILFIALKGTGSEDSMRTSAPPEGEQPLAACCVGSLWYLQWRAS